MAAKKSAKKSPSKKASAGSGDRIVDAALAEAAAVGWPALTLDAVADRAGMSLGELLAEVPTRTHVVLRQLDSVDRRMLAGVKADADESPRDRLFDVLMRRFDVLNADREGVRAMITGVMRDPCAAALVLFRLQRSAAVILAAAGISTAGPLGFVRIQGLGAVAATGLRAWMNDDSADLSKTMAAVDRALARAERFAGMMTFRRRGAADEAAA
jgi:ubiquinone biosynthesis protein COQ9